LNFENLSYSFQIENTKKSKCMEHKQTTSLHNPNIGENVIFSFLAVADSVKTPLKTNNATNTTFIAEPFY
jgi:hypothetical protein